MDVIGIQAANTVGFVEAVFDCYKNNKLFAVSSYASLLEFNHHSGLQADKFIIPSERGQWLEADYIVVANDKPAQIVFTSGTEGQPKAIVLSHNNLKNVVDRINVAMEVDASIREYIGVPVYHSFGLGRCRAVAAAGGKAYIPKNGFDLNEIRSMLEADKINAISAVPSLWRVLLDNAAMFTDVSNKVKWIEIGSQFMSADEKSRLRMLFSQAKIVQHYGLTEASRTSLLRIDTAMDLLLDSVGESGDTIELALSENGTLKIRGPHVALGRIVDNKIISIVDDEQWFVTSDLCEIKAGYLYFRGRADDVINCGGVKFDPANIEAELNKAYSPQDYAYISRIPDAYRGDGILLSILDSSSRDKKALINTVDALLAEKNINARSAIQVATVANIPKTATNKIKRNELSALYLASADKKSIVKNTKTVIGLYQSIFNTDDLNETDSFSSLGGDSLTYVRASVELEKIIGFLPPSWENISIKDLSGLSSSSSVKRKTTQVEMGIFLRFYAIIAVVSHHGGITALKGGAVLLMFIAGYNYLRFQLPRQLTGNPASIFKSLFINVLLPYWLVIITYMGLKGYEIEWLDMLFISNNIYPKGINVPFQIWFVDVLVQCILLFSLPLFVTRIREWVKSNQVKYILFFVVLFYLLRIADGLFSFGANNSLGGGQTSWVAWLFALGALVFAVNDKRIKFILSIITVLSAVVFYTEDMSRWLIISIGGVLIIWVTQLPMPKIVVPLVQIVSGASLFIYMLHGRAPANSISADWPVDVIRIGGGIAIGVIGYLLYNWGISMLFKIKSYVAARQGKAN